MSGIRFQMSDRFQAKPELYMHMHGTTESIAKNLDRLTKNKRIIL